MARQPQNVLFRLPIPDLDEILRLAYADLVTLRGRRIFLTGGTGFFGKWLVGALVQANEQLELGLELTLLSRDPDRFRREHPEIEKAPGLTFLHGDIVDVAFPGAFDLLIHAAADATVPPTAEEEKTRDGAMVKGMVRMLDFARHGGARRVLNISSGAVYGAAVGQPGGAREEDFDASVPATGYGLAKKEAELISRLYPDLTIVHARAFAFVGPYLPLDTHFAAGNFIRDALAGGPVQVRGDGTAVRSYLYPVDLVVWLLALLVRGQSGRAYNVGSDKEVTTAGLAQLAAETVVPHAKVAIQHAQPQGPQNIYLPDIIRARSELGLEISVPLREAILRTVAWHRPG